MVRTGSLKKTICASSLKG